MFCWPHSCIYNLYVIVNRSYLRYWKNVQAGLWVFKKCYLCFGFQIRNWGEGWGKGLITSVSWLKRTFFLLLKLKGVLNMLHFLLFHSVSQQTVLLLNHKTRLTFSSLASAHVISRISCLRAPMLVGDAGSCSLRDGGMVTRLREADLSFHSCLPLKQKSWKGLAAFSCPVDHPLLQIKKWDLAKGTPFARKRGKRLPLSRSWPQL